MKLLGPEINLEIKYINTSKSKSCKKWTVGKFLAEFEFYTILHILSKFVIICI